MQHCRLQGPGQRTGHRPAQAAQPGRVHSPGLMASALLSPALAPLCAFLRSGKQRCLGPADRQEPRREELLELPDELLGLVLPSLQVSDVATLMQVCKKLNTLAVSPFLVPSCAGRCSWSGHWHRVVGPAIPTPGAHPPGRVQGLEQRWQELYAGRFGCSSLSREAAKLAGTWQRLYKLKHQSDQAANGWDRLSHVEMRAAAARFAQRTVEGRLHVVFLLDGSGSVTEGAPGWARLGCLAA